MPAWFARPPGISVSCDRSALETCACSALPGGRGFRLRGFLAGVLEQEIEGFLRPDIRGDPAERPLFLELRASHRHGLPLLPCDALHLAVDLILRRADGFPVGDLIENQ